MLCSSGALIVGVFLRSKLGFLQKTFIPASVVGGFILLLLGPQAFNVTEMIGINVEWYKYYAMIPGNLIVPVVAGVPLGLRLGHKNGAIDSGLFYRSRCLNGSICCKVSCTSFV